MSTVMCGIDFFSLPIYPQNYMELHV